MKNRLLSLVQKAIAPIALFTAMAAFSPATVMAQNRGHDGGRGGHSFSAPNRGNANAGRSFENGNGRGGNFNRGNQLSDGGRGFSRGFDRGRGGYPGGYYGRGAGFGVGVYPTYGYAGPVCDPAGFYDRFGVWHFYPGCAVPY